MADHERGHLEGDEILWRRVHTSQWVADAKTGERRISSGAFTDPELSVDRASVRVSEGNNHKVTQGDAPAVASFAARAALELELGVVADPLADNAAHALVVGPKPRSVQRALQRASTPLT